MSIGEIKEISPVTFCFLELIEPYDRSTLPNIISQEKILHTRRPKLSFSRANTVYCVKTAFCCFLLFTSEVGK